MVNFMSGMISAGYLIAALFFFRFWRRTADSLFFIFGVSFVLFAISQAAVVLGESLREDRSWVYILRLLGFGLLLACIVWKNTKRRA